MSNYVKNLTSPFCLSLFLATFGALSSACSQSPTTRPPDTGGSAGQGGDNIGGGAGTPSSGGGASTAGANNGGANNVGGNPTGGAGGAGGSATGSGGTPGTGGGSSDAATPQDDTGGAKLGGSSARAVCAPGATYGNPLTGMGAVTMINAPTTGSVTYFAFIEGPVWIASLGTLFFSDNASQPAERIFKLVPPATTPQIFLESSGSNGLAVDNDDKLILADQLNHRIVRLDPVSSQMLGVVVPAGSFKPNDVIVRSDGSIYFTDPASGFYQVSPTGVLGGPFRQVQSPNGIELSLDENMLLVGDVNNRSITKFPVGANGAVDATRGTMFVQTMGTTADGMALDCAGNVYVCTQMGVEVYSPTGTFIGTVPTTGCSNATFGGADRKTLYVTTPSVLKAVTLNVPGLPD